MEAKQILHPEVLKIAGKAFDQGRFDDAIEAAVSVALAKMKNLVGSSTAYGSTIFPKLVGVTGLSSLRSDAPTSSFGHAKARAAYYFFRFISSLRSSFIASSSKLCRDTHS